MERITRRAVLATPALALAASRKPRLRTAICAYSFRDELKAGRMTYTDLINLAVDLDVDGLDLTVYWFPNTSDAFLIPLRQHAYRNGVELYSISVRTNCCQPTAELRAKETQAIRDWVDVAVKLGAGHIRVFGGTVPKGSSEDEAAGWVAEVLKHAGEYASSKGVILGLENHGGITEKATRIVEIVRRVNLPSVAVNLDMGNFQREAYEQLEMLAPYAANVQVKVDLRDNAGQKVRADWERILKMLTASGYRGYLALEYEESAPAPAAVPRLTRELNALVKKFEKS